MLKRTRLAMLACILVFVGLQTSCESKLFVTGQDESNKRTTNKNASGSDDKKPENLPSKEPITAPKAPTVPEAAPQTYKGAQAPGPTTAFAPPAPWRQGTGQSWVGQN